MEKLINDFFTAQARKFKDLKGGLEIKGHGTIFIPAWVRSLLLLAVVIVNQLLLNGLESQD